MQKLGVILSGGFGTRMFPATKTTNKHLLPVYSDEGAFPMIEYPVNTLINLGVKKILIITSREHCGKIVDYLGDGYSRGVEFTYKIQEMNDPNRPPGIASALKLCEDFTGDNRFVVILGDNYFEWHDYYKNFYDSFMKSHAFDVGLFLKQTDEWQRFGVAKLEKDDDERYDIITDIVEKPKKFISDLAITGMYFYSPDVYKVANKLKPSKRGELEISDLNKYFAKLGTAQFMIMENFWSDMGTPESIMITQNHLSKSI